jgi:hypothetical protein
MSVSDSAEYSQNCFRRHTEGAVSHTARNKIDNKVIAVFAIGLTVIEVLWTLSLFFSNDVCRRVGCDAAAIVVLSLIPQFILVPVLLGSYAALVIRLVLSRGKAS